MEFHSSCSLERFDDEVLPFLRRFVIGKYLPAGPCVPARRVHASIGAAESRSVQLREHFRFENARIINITSESYSFRKISFSHHERHSLK